MANVKVAQVDCQALQTALSSGECSLLPDHSSLPTRPIRLSDILVSSSLFQNLFHLKQLRVCICVYK